MEIDLVKRVKIPMTHVGSQKSNKILVLGKTHSYQTWTIISILKRFNPTISYDLFVIADTEHKRSLYRRNFSDAIIHKEFTPFIVKNMFNLQRQYNREKKIVFVIDVENTNIKDDGIRRLLFEGSFYNIDLILSLHQHNYYLSPALRAQFHYVFLRENDNIEYQKKIYNSFCGMCPSFDIFKRYFTELTKDYGSMVIQRNGCRSEITYFKPLPVETITIPFGVCPQCLRKYDGYDLMESLDREIFGVPRYNPDYVHECVNIVSKLKEKGVDVDKLLDDEPEQIEPTNNITFDNMSDTSNENNIILNHLKNLKRRQKIIKSSDTSSEQNDDKSDISMTDSEKSEESHISSVESCKELGL